MLMSRWCASLGLVGVGAALSATLGVGGGGVFLGILLGFLRLSPLEARSISSCCVLATVVAGTLATALRQHRRGLRLIDPGAVAVLGAVQIGGGAFGTLLVNALPPLLLLALSVVASLLALLSLWKAFWRAVAEKKAKALAGAEAKPLAEARASAEDGVRGEAFASARAEAWAEVPARITVSAEGCASAEASASALASDSDPLFSEKQSVPSSSSSSVYLTLLALWFFAFLCTVGQKRRFLSVPAAAWLLLRAVVPSGYALAQAVRLAQQPAAGERQLVLTPRKARRLLAAGFAIGLISAAMGFGGGMFTGPLLLSVGLDPLRAGYTVSTVIILGTSNNVANMIIEGLVGTEQVPWAVVAFCSALFGRSVLDKGVRNLELSPCVLALLFVLLCASILNLVVDFAMKASAPLNRAA